MSRPNYTADEKQALVELGEDLRRAIKERGLTYDELAERLGVTKSYISDICRGRYNVSYRVLRRIGKVIDANITIRFEKIKKK